MIRNQRSRLGIVGAAVLLVASAGFASSDTTEQPKPEHPKATHPKPVHHKQYRPNAYHPKPDHPKPQKLSAHKSTHHSRPKVRKHSRGQQAIDNERAQQIQEALIRQHYLSGEPSGTWDASTQDAMRRYQADQGWQTKVVPDSRALIRLGLGPDQAHLLNPESAMTADSQIRQASTARVSPVSVTVAPVSARPMQNSEPASSAPQLTPAR
jgi:Putative peptidoglycan binding domain